MLRRITTALFLALFVASCILSCAKPDRTTDVATGSPDNTQTEAGTEEIFISDNLPDDHDCGGKTISLLWMQDNGNTAEKLNGEVVNDALYYRDRKTEERLNVVIENIEELYTWAKKDEYLNRIKSSALADDDAYDIVSGQYATMPSLIAEGIYYNLMNVAYLDLAMPWWVQGLIEETTIDGKLYLVSGDMAMPTIASISCLFFNKEILADYNIEEPYGVVLDGGWTYEYFKGIISQIYDDLNGNSLVDNEDLFGFIVPSGNQITPYLQAFDLKITTLDSEGYPVLSFGDEKTSNAVTELCALLHNTDYAMIGNDNIYDEMNNIYNQNRAAFMSQVLNYAVNLKGNDSDFGVLPHPKYNREQGDYYTAISELNTLLGIVSSCDDPDMVSAVMECLASESYRQVSPAFFETALKVKYSRDNESTLMFDIIRSGVLFNFGSIYGFNMSSINTRFKEAIMTDKSDWISFYNSFSKAAESGISKFYDTVRQLP